MENRKQGQWVLVVIGGLKLFKAILLLVIATQLHWLLDPNAAHGLEQFVHHFRIDPGNHHIHEVISRVTGISPTRLHEVRLGSYIYAGLFATEGIGLVLRKRWAEYFTAITTGLLLPVEVYEIFQGQHHVVKIIVFLLNLAIVVYLVMRLRKEQHIRTA